MTAVEVRTLKSACAAVISPTGKVLMALRFSPNRQTGKREWEIPGGCPEPGERAVLDVAQRELCEELGVDAAGWPCRVYEVESEKFPGSYYGLAVFFVPDYVRKPELKFQAGEVCDAAWRDLDDVEGMIAFQARAFMPLVRQAVAEVLGSDLR
jgi:8-oxo-dGTP pyrophosphatase MutT (NUDIX family)